jgi:PKD repeat protein
VSIRGPDTGETDTSIQFLAVVTTRPGEAAQSFTWEFGDGGAATGWGPAHTYATEGLYLIRLTVTTNLDTLTATKVVAIEPGGFVEPHDDVDCFPARCGYAVEFKYDRQTDTFLTVAGMFIPNGSPDYQHYQPALRVLISREGSRVFEESFDAPPTNVHSVTADFAGFFERYHPRPGRWKMDVWLSYKPIEEPDRHGWQRGYVWREEFVYVCEEGGCNVQPEKVTLREGYSQRFTLINPYAQRQYSWHYEFAWKQELPGQFGNGPPDAHLTPPEGVETLAFNPQWVAVRGYTCPPTEQIRRKQALENAEYYIWVEDGASESQSRESLLKVIVPWAIPGASGPGDHVELPDGRLAFGMTQRPYWSIVVTGGEPIVHCSGGRCWLVPSELPIPEAPEPPLITLAPTAAASGGQFKAKFLAHEEAHKNFWSGECGSRYFQRQDLVAALEACAADLSEDIGCNVPISTSEYEARRLVRDRTQAAINRWQEIEERDARLTEALDERKALDESDEVAPHFLYQRCPPTPDQPPPCPRAGP